MTKFQQKQILELLQTVKDAQVAELYADCQQGALAAGEFIEAVEGEGTGTVALLEQYCELVFKASNGEATQSELTQGLIKVENSIKTELKPGKFSVVFFPYRASMWDSLESIYLAAKEDPQCDAYVVPIPFYDVLPEGNLGEEHYDGAMYPKDIPVTDWLEYDVEARHPDVIFTHYPYDDLGGNIMVHPDFFSKRLRNHCELLAYVPYFVVPGEEVEDYNAFLPGVLHADYVFVQSEGVRQSYIKHYNRFDEESGWDGKYGKAEEKFVALGSPKFDKVANSKREEFELPQDWARLIYGK